MENGKNVALKVEQEMTFAQLKEQAEMLIKSRFLPVAVDTAEKAVAIIMTGKELGMRPMESFRSINVIQGKPTLSAQALLALCYRTGQVESAGPEKETDTEAIFTIKRKGSPVYKSVFTLEDAKKLGLSGKDNWQKQPKTMLMWRAISKAARAVFPDATLGLYTPEEIQSEAVEVNPTPEGKEQEVVKAPAKDADKVEEIKESLPSTEGPNGLPDIGSIDQLGAYMLQPPYDKNFPDKNIMEIYHTTTPAGKPKGSIFLEMISKHSKIAEEKAIVQKFLEAIKTV